MKLMHLAIALMGSVQLVAFCPQREWEGGQVISLLELNEEAIQDFLEGRMANYALEFPEGVCLPLKMIVRGEFLALDSAAAALPNLKILKTCYVRYEGDGNFLFSADLKEWKNFSDFFAGKLTASVKVQEKELVAGLELELNQRTIESIE